MDPFTLALAAAVVLGAGTTGVVHHRRAKAAPPPGAPRTPGRTLLFRLAHAPFPAAAGPSVAVRVPPGWDPGAPLDLAVYFRGFGNCVGSLMGPPSACHPGGPVHTTSHLAEQWDAGGRNGLLVMPELRVEEQTGDPGALRRPGSMAALLDELLGEHLRPLFGGARRGAADVRRLHLMSHSGGYSAVAAVLRQADVAPRVDEVVLLDSLYGDDATFNAWAEARAGAMASGAARLGVIYTAGGGTAAHSRAMAAKAARWLAAAPAALHVDDRARGELAPGDYRKGAIFHRSKLSHGDTSRHYPSRFWATGGMSPRAGAR